MIDVRSTSQVQVTEVPTVIQHEVPVEARARVVLFWISGNVIISSERTKYMYRYRYVCSGMV